MSHTNMNNFYAAPTHIDSMLKELGIDNNSTNNVFDPKNQPLEIGKQFHRVSNNQRANKYAQEDSEEK